MNFDYLEIAWGSYHFILLLWSLGPECSKIRNQIVGCQNQKLNLTLSPPLILYITFVECPLMSPTWVCRIILMAVNGWLCTMVGLVLLLFLLFSVASQELIDMQSLFAVALAFFSELWLLSKMLFHLYRSFQAVSLLVY